MAKIPLNSSAKDLRIAVMSSDGSGYFTVQSALSAAGFNSYNARPKIIDYFRLQKYHPDLIFIDVDLPNFYNRNWIRLYKLIYPDTKIIVLSEFLDNNHIRRNYASGVDMYLLKALIGPFDVKRLINYSLQR